MTTARTGVIVLLRSKLALALAPTWPIKTFTANGHVYLPVGPEWSGFYDWLRSERGFVLGIRYHPNEDTNFLLKDAAGLSYATVGPYEDLCIFFGEDRAFDPAQSQDQDFAYDQVYSSAAGSAICFSAENLSAAQLDELLGSHEITVIETSQPPECGG